MKVKIGKYPKDESDRKIDIKIDDYDTWNLDATLSLIIYPSLIKFREKLNGYWNPDKNDLPDHIDDFDEYGYTIKGTEWIIDEMIWSFWAINNYEKDNLDISWINKDDPDRIRFDNGLRLFGKYYMNLWN